MARVTAAFADHGQADAAIAELRRRGIADSHLSIVAKRVEDVEVNRRPEATAGERVAKGAITGVGVGTLFGLAAAVIPGVGLVAGPLAAALGATGASAALGAAIGGTSGALAGAMADRIEDPDTLDGIAEEVDSNRRRLFDLRTLATEERFERGAVDAVGCKDIGRRRGDDFRAPHPQQLAPLLRGVLRHHADEAVPLELGRHGE